MTPQRCIEAVVVCVDYSDFLAWTLPANRWQFDKMVVVTAPRDEATQRLCERYDVECVVTDTFYAGGDAFAKGRGINAGLARLSRRDWVLHMDSDIYMPPKTRQVLNNLPLDPAKLYSADRLMCPSAEAFAAYLDEPPPVQSDWVFVHANAFPLGVRIAQYAERGGGYVPIGYWQLWNPRGSGVERYPEHHGTAARTDFQHGTAWPRQQRELLPEVVLVHLESAPGMALNWEGRRTPPFRLAPQPRAEPPAPPQPNAVTPPHLPRYVPRGFLQRLTHAMRMFFLRALQRIRAALRRFAS
jgi:hypothetical protein